LCSFYPILFSFYRHHRDLHSFPTRRSSDLVLSLGFLLIVSLIVNGLLMVFMDYVTRLLSDLVVYLSIALDAIINFIVISALFGVDRKSTRLNSSHVKISYAVFCLKKKKQIL